MTTIRGQLKAEQRAGFAGYRVRATFEERIADASAATTGAESTPTFVPAERIAIAGSNGAFEFELPVREAWRGPLALTAVAPSGIVVGQRAVGDDELAQRIDFTVQPLSLPTVSPTTDPTSGLRVKLIGRVLTTDGAGVPSGLQVLVMGVRASATDAYPLLVATTTAGGWFSELWPADELAQAFATVASGDAIPIPLVETRLPRTIVLQVESVADPADKDEHDCACVDSPPRAPDPIDLVTNPAAFSADPGRCIDVTVPNRTLEEVTFHAVVRTSEPEVQGMTLPDPDAVPSVLTDRLSALVSLRANVLTSSLQAAALQPSADANAFDASATGGAGERDRMATELMALRREVGRPTLSIDRAATRALVRDAEQLTASDLLTLEQDSHTRLVKNWVDVYTSAPAGRVSLDRDHSIDWDDTPTIHQATTIAHGHLLTFRQVWRADGYSLGDLLYSMPLAPGQKKQVAIVDWERQESAAREASRTIAEEVAAELAHDRDISEIISTSLQEHVRAKSSATTSSVGGGIGGFIGPVIFGIGGGASGAGSTASQNSSRDVTGTMLNQARDRTTQAASSVRSQRTSVVQTARQGESVRVQTEVVANYNHCHAITVEYFEVLRHFQVTNELVAVQECLFIPFELTPFTNAKAARYRDALLASLRDRSFAGAFDAIERVRTNWVDADFPVARYADEAVVYLDAELTMSFSLPRPKDKEDNTFDAAAWAIYTPLLPQSPQTIWEGYLGVALPADREYIWQTRIAPKVADAIVRQLRINLRLDNGATTASTILDPTLVSRYAPDRPLLVSLRPSLAGPGVTRARVTSVVLSLNAILPANAKMVVQSGEMRYRTDHMNAALFESYRIDNDLSAGDVVEVPTPLSTTEKRNPRKEDLRYADTLVDHLNEHVEYYHEAVWRALDANRRYLLLDGYLAPNAGGRSVASVVENRLIGVVGNCLVMPVVAGIRLDQTYQFARRTQADLIDAYVTERAQPFRISVPTKGVFAEAIMGKCNSCESKDDTRFWRWEQSPLPDSPAAILPVSTASRRTAPPNLSPDALPDPLVRLQDVPRSVDPTGLAAAMELIGTPNLFRDLTGIDLNQQNAAAAFKSALDTAKFFGGEAAKIAQQRFLNREMDRTLKRIKDAKDKGLITDDQARSLTSSALKGGAGQSRDKDAKPTQHPAVQRAIDRVAQSDNGSLKVTNPQGSVEVKTGDRATVDEPMAFTVQPPVPFVKQKSGLTCWAAAGAMLLSWKRQTPFTNESFADTLGADWRQKLDDNIPLARNELRLFLDALGLTGEGGLSYLPRGILRLLRLHGPLWVIGDDAVPGNELAHVRIVTGIKGDGSVKGTKVVELDPDSGEIEQDFEKFIAGLVAKDAVGVGFGIFYFP